MDVFIKILNNTIYLFGLTMLVKSIFIGIDFDFWNYFKYKKQYWNWFKNNESFQRFKETRTLRLTKARKRFMTVKSDTFQHLFNNDDNSVRYLDIRHLQDIEVGIPIVFVEQTGTHKDKDIQLGKYRTYLVKEINMAPVFEKTNQDGYDTTYGTRIAVLLPVLE